MILVDSCVFIDVLESDPKWADWSQEQLETWSARGPLLINPVIYAELAAYAKSKESLETEIATADLLMRDLPRDALFLAGRAHAAIAAAADCEPGSLRISWSVRTPPSPAARCSRASGGATPHSFRLWLWSCPKAALDEELCLLG